MPPRLRDPLHKIVSCNKVSNFNELSSYKSIPRQVTHANSPILNTLISIPGDDVVKCVFALVEYRMWCNITELVSLIRSVCAGMQSAW